MVIFFLYFLSFVLAQDYALNFCSPDYQCSGSNLCGPTLNYYYMDHHISDRSGYICSNNECVKPECSFYAVAPNAWAPTCSNTSETCNEDYQCEEKTIPSIMNLVFISTGKAHLEVCGSNNDCLPNLFCNYTDHKCHKRVLPSPNCPSICTATDQCLFGECINGFCEKTKRGLGESCILFSDCASGNCSTEGVCTGLSCDDLQCPEDYFCAQSENFLYGPVECYPVMEKFSCDFNTHYPHRANITWIDCLPKKNSGDCVGDFECTGFCSQYTCVSYPKLSIPYGELCGAVYSQCADGLYCNNLQKCDVIKEHGENCTTSAECSLGLLCLFDEIENTHKCIHSLTLNETCGWNTQGYHNCSENEICSCLGQTTPTCVDPASSLYQSKYMSEAGADPFAMKVDAVSTVLDYCKNNATGFDFANYYYHVPYPMQKSYLKNKLTDCPTFGDYTTIFNSPGCRKMHAKFFCCFLCGLQDYIDSTGISQTDKLFASGFDFLLNPKYKLTCGFNPDFQIADEHACGITQSFSWNDLVTTLDCAKTPSYKYLVSFVVSGVSTYQSAIEAVLIDFLTEEGIETPVTYHLSIFGGGYNSVVITLYYHSSTDANDAKTKINYSFNDYISSELHGASAGIAKITSEGLLVNPPSPPSISPAEPPSSSSGMLVFSFISLALVVILFLFL